MKLTVDVNKKKDYLGDLYGLFFEDINHAADGGLYGELVRNRSFEFAAVDNRNYHGLYAWERICQDDRQVRLVLETGNPVSDKNPHYLGLDVLEPGDNVGVMNLGYNSGMWFRSGAEYIFTCYAKREQDHDKPLKVSLRDAEGKEYVSKKFTVTNKWERYEFILKQPDTEETSGRLAITVEGRGKVYLDFVSLFPKDTFKGRRNGLRKDIAEMLAAVKPKFLRFPGGCLVHDGSLDASARDSQYRYKNTLDIPENRPARRNNWGYNQTLGLGYYEYFLFCEDIGAKPLPVVPAGYDPHHKRALPFDKMQEMIDETLDLIEFANGPADSEWGSVRAKLGHPEPFSLEYLGIGNEEVGQDFFDRYDIIHKAVKEKYPDIKLINTASPFAAGTEYDRGWENALKNGSDLIDEHYYMHPEWFIANNDRYDDFDGKVKVFLGEYATWGNTWYNALVEASYMIGLERNAKSVGLACYAPLLCNADYVNWRPDMIWFNNHQVYGTANYYVQKLFSENQGEYTLDFKMEDVPADIPVTENPDMLIGDVTLRSVDNDVEYKAITITNLDTGEKRTYGDLKITREEKERTIDNIAWKNYSVSYTATELTGFKGFQIHVAKKDSGNFVLWELGAWQNQDGAIVHNVNGRGACLTQRLIEIERGRDYKLEIKIEGNHVSTYIDGELFQKAQVKPVILKPLYCMAVVDGNGDIIIKAVNLSKVAREMSIKLDGMFTTDTTKTACVYTMAGYKPEDMNSFEEPEKVKSEVTETTVNMPEFDYEFPAESIVMIRIKKN